MKLAPLAALACAVPLLGDSIGFDERMDALGQALSYSSAGAQLRARLSGAVDLEYHSFDGSPPGLIDTRHSSFFQTRSSFFLDAQAGDTLYAFAQARVDRGFDPRDGGLEARLDEAFLRYSPWTDGRFNLQAGVFSTVVGQWHKRHLSWQNPFISAPLIYEQVTRISDDYRRYDAFPAVEVEDRWLYAYNPLVWGPSYASGVALSGKRSRFEWAVEMKNASLSSRPQQWPITQRNFSAPTYSGRIAWRPDARWNLGLSASRGACLMRGFDAPSDPGYFQPQLMQRVAALDLSYEWRFLQLWAEAFIVEFDLAAGGKARSSSSFLEAKYKLNPQLFFSLRLNQQDFSLVNRYYDEPRRWGENQLRLDLAVTWRLSAYLQAQFEVNLRDERSGLIEMGNRIATRVTLRY